MALYHFAKQRQLTPDTEIHVVEIRGETRGTETVKHILEWLSSSDGADAFEADPAGVRMHLLEIAKAQGLFRGE